MQRLSRHIGIMACALFAVSLASNALQAREKRCNRAANVAFAAKPLPSLAERVESANPIRIVAFGSSSTEGTPDIPKSEIYPSVLERMLAREVHAPVEVINKGKGGETISDMIQRLERDVLVLKPDIVVWQLGVNDVLVMDGVAPAVQDMRRALAMLRRVGVPVVLVDLQVARMVDNDRDAPAMQAAIAEAAKAEGVLHFRRYDMMQSMMEDRNEMREDLVHPDGLHMTPLAHFCTGSLLAKQIASGSTIRMAKQVGR